MAVPVQNGYEVFEEEKFADDFVPFLTPIKEIHGKRTARSYISTSSINEKTLPDSLGDELDNTFSQSFVNKTHSDNMRQEHSFLKVDKKEVNVGEVINICWNVAEPCSANDWIGIFKSSELAVCVVVTAPGPMLYLSLCQKALSASTMRHSSKTCFCLDSRIPSLPIWGRKVFLSTCNVFFELWPGWTLATCL